MLDQSFDSATGKGTAYLAGYEFAGEVAAVGDGVTAPAVGERVMGIAQGAFAPYVLADHRHVSGPRHRPVHRARVPWRRRASSPASPYWLPARRPLSA